MLQCLLLMDTYQEHFQNTILSLECVPGLPVSLPNIQNVAVTVRCQQVPSLNVTLSLCVVDTMDSVGILEMGGASTQIAFVPDTSVLADKFPVTLGGVRYPLYVHR